MQIPASVREFVAAELPQVHLRRIDPAPPDSAPSPLAYDRHSAVLVRIIGRLWRAAEDWVVEATDLNKQDSIRIIRHIERLRADARRTDGAHLAHLQREFAMLEQLLPLQRVPPSVSNLIDAAHAELQRLQFDAGRGADTTLSGAERSPATPPATLGPVGDLRQAQTTRPWLHRARYVAAGLAGLALLSFGWWLAAAANHPARAAAAPMTEVAAAKPQPVHPRTHADLSDAQN